MKLVITDEVQDWQDLAQYLSKQQITLPEFRVGVISVLTNQTNQFLLQRRGPKSRTDRFLLSEISGEAETYDSSFRDALMRELEEEVGTEAQFRLDDFIGGFFTTKFDKREQNNVNWLFLFYKGAYLGGQLQIKEPEKCLGYESFAYEDLPVQELCSGSRFINQFYHEKQMNQATAKVKKL